MAWWVKKDISYLGPHFDWVDQDVVEEKRNLAGLGLSLSRPLSERNVPKAARSRRPAKAPPRQDVFIVDSSVACNGRFKDLVEQFEPGMNLFAPIELQYHDGRPMEGEFYFFNCNVDIDCVLTDNKPEWFTDFGNGKVVSEMPLIQLLTPLEISLSKPQIQGRHLWTGGPLGWNQLFVSDPFCTALRKGRYKALEIWRECHEVDREWVAEEHMGPLLAKWQAYVASDRDCEIGAI